MLAGSENVAYVAQMREKRKSGVVKLAPGLNDAQLLYLERNEEHAQSHVDVIDIGGSCIGTKSKGGFKSSIGMRTSYDAL